MIWAHATPASPMHQVQQQRQHPLAAEGACPAPPTPACRAYDSRLLSARTCQLQSQEPIEREGSSAARAEEEEDRSPGEMVGPGVGIHKRLDDREHTQERQRGSTWGQAKHEQDRTSKPERKEHLP